MATIARDDDGTSRYTRVAILLHWVIAALIVVNLVIGLLHESLLKGTIPLHKSIGLTVLALSLARLAWRLFNPPPPLPADVPRWQRAVAHVNHWIFYALMILLPLSGWVFTSAGSRKYPTDFFGLFTVPPIVGQDKALSDTVAERHEQLAWIMIALIALHVAAALKHHLLDRDRTLVRMLPATDRS